MSVGYALVSCVEVSGESIWGHYGMIELDEVPLYRHTYEESPFQYGERRAYWEAQLC